MPDRAPFLPPLLSSRPRPVQVGAVVVPPLIGGFLTGATLGWSVGAWVLANVLATLGGFLAGFDHDRLGESVRRGAAVSLASTLVLLGLTGRHLLPQLVVVLAAVAWMAWRRRTQPRLRGVAPAAPDLA